MVTRFVFQFNTHRSNGLAVYAKYFLLFLIAHFHFESLAQTSVVTQHNDLSRTGWYSRELKLNTKNVAPGSFGFLFRRLVDDQIYAQPLVLMRVNMPGKGIKNVCYVATVNNTVYAFDADSANVVSPYWQVSLNPAGGRPQDKTDLLADCGEYRDFSGKFGIVGTPVIDSLLNTLYVVVKSYAPAGFQQHLHALDVKTGAERPNSPVLITATVPGTGSGTAGGNVSFNALKHNQRSGLLLLNGVVYITWASHQDCDPYHGWIIGYDQVTMAQVRVYNATPNGYKGGIWMSACGMAADADGNIYAAVGNGSVGVDGNPADIINRGESALKLTVSGSTLVVSSFFTPTNYEAMEVSDLDFGVNGMLLIPGSNRVVSGAKDGNVYLMNRDNMGGYSASGNNVIQGYYQGSIAHNLTSLTYYGGTAKEYVYTWSDNVYLKALPFDRATQKFDLPNMRVNSIIQGPVGYNGGFLSVSSNGSVDSTAVLWATYRQPASVNPDRPGILRAFSAADISKELWNSSLNGADELGFYAKFNCPTIANSKVYLGTFSNQLMVYGLKAPVITEIRPDENDRPRINPNPARNSVRITLKHNVPVSVKIVDLHERVVYEGIVNNPGALLDVSTLTPGLYIFLISIGDRVYTEKVVIQRD